MLNPENKQKRIGEAIAAFGQMLWERQHYRGLRTQRTCQVQPLGATDQIIFRLTESDAVLEKNVRLTIPDTGNHADQ